MKKYLKLIVVLLLIAVVGVSAFYRYESRQELDYAKNLDKTAVTIDGEEIPLYDLAFYIVYEEGQVEQQALVYNPDNTRDYWNLHIDGTFIQTDAKNTIMQMAIHDQVFYELAMKEGIELTADDEKQVTNVISDFWMDLLDEQQDRIPVPDEYINKTIMQIAYADKYQAYLADKNGDEYVSYSWDGYYYEQLLEKEHKVKINKKVWDRIVVGNITLNHGDANYINGQDE